MKKHYFLYIFFLFFQAVQAQPEYDPDFGNNGFLEFDNGVEHIFKIKTLDNGKFYIIANYYPDRESGDYTRYAYISRHLPDGSYDTSFGNGGMTVLTDYPDSVFLDFDLLPDQSIICNFIKRVNYQYERYIIKLTSNGQIDTSFGNNGFANYAHYALAIQPDGKIIVSGKNEQSDNPITSRLFPDGNLDLSFGTQGITEFNTSEPNEYIRQINILPDNSIIYLMANLGDAFLAKTDADGHLITNFGNQGILSIDTPPDNKEYITQFFITEQQNILVTGGQDISTGDMFGAQESMLAQYDINGNLDTGFGNNGYVITDLTSGNSTGWSAILQPDGKIVQFIKSGYPMSAYNGENQTSGLARFTADGQLDTSFATDGYFMDYYAGYNSNHVFYSMQWHLGNNLLMAGVNSPGNHFGFIARVKNVYDSGVIEDTNAVQVGIYPNPAGKYLHIQSEIPVSKTEIFSINGQLIRPAQTDILDVSDLAAGVYLLHIQTEKGLQIKKFVKM